MKLVRAQQFGSLLLLFLLALLSGCHGQRNVVPPERSTILSHEPQKEALPRVLPIAGAYSLEIWNNHFDLLNHKTKVYTESISPGEMVNVAFMLPDNSKSCNDLVLERSLANGTFEYFVLRLGGKIQKITTVATGYSPLREQKSNDTHRYVTKDWFLDWGARPVAPDIVLKWNGKKFELDKEVMRHKLPTSAEQKLIAKGIKEQFGLYSSSPDDQIIDAAPPELASQVMVLYYCGRNDLARNFFNDCWPATRPGKRKYWDFLMHEIRKSPYWSTVSSLNGMSAS